MKIEILSALTEALEQETLKSTVETGLDAYTNYKTLIKNQNAVISSLSESDEADHIEKKEDLDFLIEELAHDFSKKHKEYKYQLKREEQDKNKVLKEAVIEKFRALISSEENIGKAFINFNKLQDDWKEIGDVSSDDYHRIQSEYSRLRESFFYNIKIYKELADHDKKKNLDEKLAIIEEVKFLNKEKSISKQGKSIRELIKKWDGIGITFEENWNSLREEFWTNARTILNRVDKHYEDLREKGKDNLVFKERIIDQVVELSSVRNTNASQWKKSTDKILEAQANWKKIGRSENNEQVWKSFRKECDVFFDAKRKFYDKLKVGQGEVEEKKQDLIKQAEILKDSDDWKDSTRAMLLLQKRWKEAGSTNPKRENALWKTFRSHQDHFFKKKTEFYAGKEDREKENLKKKNAIIKKIKAFKTTDKPQEDLKQLKEFAQEWQTIGFVPFSKKESNYNEYKEALDKHYSALKMDKKEMSKIRFESKIEGLKKQKDPDKAIDFERRKIRKDIDRIKSNILQTENNLGFFNVSSGSNSMLDDINKKLKRDKDRIEELKLMLVQLRNS